MLLSFKKKKLSNLVGTTQWPVLFVFFVVIFIAHCTKATCSKGGASRVYRGFSLILGLQIFKSG